MKISTRVNLNVYNVQSRDLLDPDSAMLRDIFTLLR